MQDISTSFFVSIPFILIPESHPLMFTPTVVSTVFYIPTLEEDFDTAKSRFPDAKGKNEFKEKLGNDRKEKGQEARPWVCVLESNCEAAFKDEASLHRHVRYVHGDGENLRITRCSLLVNEALSLIVNLVILTCKTLARHFFTKFISHEFLKVIL